MDEPEESNVLIPRCVLGFVKPASGGERLSSWNLGSCLMKTNSSGESASSQPVCIWKKSVRKTSTILSIVNIRWFYHCEKLGWEWGELEEGPDFAFDFVELVPVLLLVSGPR